MRYYLTSAIIIGLLCCKIVSLLSCLWQCGLEHPLKQKAPNLFQALVTSQPETESHFNRSGLENLTNIMARLGQGWASNHKCDLLGPGNLRYVVSWDLILGRQLFTRCGRLAGRLFAPAYTYYPSWSWQSPAYTLLCNIYYLSIIYWDKTHIWFPGLISDSSHCW